METVNAKYKAKAHFGSIDIETPELPIELNKVVVWIMHHPEDAAALLPEYNRLRDEQHTRLLNCV